MKLKILATAAAAGLLSTTAMAADLPSRKVPPPVIAAVPIFTWTGFYIGAQVGYAWEQVSVDGPSLYLRDGGRRERGGVVGGGHVGYMFQPGLTSSLSSLVIGIEGDIEGRSVGRGGVAGSVRGRLGWTMDRFMIYATGGLALSDFYQSNNYFIPETAGYYRSDYQKFQAGWTVGGGVEYALTYNWAARVEYRYSDFGKATGGAFNTEMRRTEHAVRAGVSYRFGSPPAAIVAKY